jgi:iron(III) transport system substrate-binding protein
MRGRTVLLAVASVTLALSACSSGESTSTSEDALVVYSGRSEELIGPLVQQFKDSSGANVEVRYGDTAELAAQLLEEGDNSPADVFFSQDAGALQVLQEQGLTTTLPSDVVQRVPAKFRSAQDQWVGSSGRARVMVYNTDELTPADLPSSVQGLTEPQWKGKVGIAPTNASFQAFVTAMRATLGEEQTKQWLEDMVANDVQRYENNLAIVDAVNAGQVEVGLVNHYYLFEKAEEVGAENLAAENAAFAPGDIGNLVNVAGLAVLEESASATDFVTYMLSDSAQEYFAQEVSEYPLVKGIPAKEGLPPLTKVDAPDVTLDQLKDLQGTQALLMDVGLL